MNSMEARTLRLLANSYLEWDSQLHWQKALNAVGQWESIQVWFLMSPFQFISITGLANSEHSHPSGLLLKTSILFQFLPQMDDRIRAGIIYKIHY